MRLFAFVALLVVVDFALSLEQHQRRCRMGWDSVDQYPVLAEVCKDWRAMRALIAADTAEKDGR